MSSFFSAPSETKALERVLNREVTLENERFRFGKRWRTGGLLSKSAPMLLFIINKESDCIMIASLVNLPSCLVLVRFDKTFFWRRVGRQSDERMFAERRTEVDSFHVHGSGRVPVRCRHCKIAGAVS